MELAGCRASCHRTLLLPHEVDPSVTILVVFVEDPKMRWPSHFLKVTERAEVGLESYSLDSEVCPVNLRKTLRPSLAMRQGSGLDGARPGLL